MPASSAGDLNLTAQIGDVDGTPYSGPVEVRFEQTLLGTSPGTDTYLAYGPYAGSSASGIVSMAISSNDLGEIEFGKPLTVSFWRPYDSGQTGAEQMFFLDAGQAVRSVSNTLVVGPDPSGEYHVILRNLKFAEAPLYGKVSVLSAQGSHPSLHLNLSRDFPIPLSGLGVDVQTAFVEIEQLPVLYGVDTDIFSWTTGKAGFFASSSDGWRSAEDVLPRGSNVTKVTLIPEDIVKVHYDLTTYPDASGIVLFDAATYQPFDPAACPPGAANGNALMRAESEFSGGLLGFTDDGDQSTIVFEHVPAGSYVVEFWTYPGIESPAPAPTYQTTITVTGWSPVIVNIP